MQCTCIHIIIGTHRCTRAHNKGHKDKIQVQSVSRRKEKVRVTVDTSGKKQHNHISNNKEEKQIVSQEREGEGDKQMVIEWL